MMMPSIIVRRSGFFIITRRLLHFRAPPASILLNTLQESQKRLRPHSLYKEQDVLKHL